MGSSIRAGAVLLCVLLNMSCAPLWDVESDLVTVCVIIHNTSQGRWQSACLPNVISLSVVLSVVQDSGDL